MYRRLVLIILLSIPLTYASDTCKPNDEREFAYIIGYGSLMNKTSMKRTIPGPRTIIPVEVAGFKRSFGKVADIFNLKTNFLYARADENASMNAALVKISATSLKALDARENSYCRQSIRHDQLKVLSSDVIDDQANIWIYVSSPEDHDHDADDISNSPITQSYVDVFLTGCLDIEKDHKIAGFAQNCVSTTEGWMDAPLVNDRIFPRRPWVHEPNAMTIDEMLFTHEPKIINKRRLEA